MAHNLTASLNDVPTLIKLLKEKVGFIEEKNEH
jgi:hypothetical protein